MKFSAPEIIKMKLPSSRVYVVTELNSPWLTEPFYELFYDWPHHTPCLALWGGS